MNSAPMSRSTPMLDTSASDVLSLRNFVVDEDRANLGADLYKSLDKTAFILAQRDAIEAYNLAMAIRLSEESAKNEQRIRLAQPARSANPSVPSPSPQASSSRSPSKHHSSSSRPVLNSDPSPSSSKVSSASLAAAATLPDSSQQQKRRKASISQSQSQSQPHYSYSSSNYHNQSNAPSTSTATSHASVHAQQQLKKHSSSSASSRDIQAGQILNPKESSPRNQSPSSSASAQAAAAERERDKEKQRSRSNSASNSSSHSRNRSSSSAAHQVHTPQPQTQPQVQVLPQIQTQPQQQANTQRGPIDIFAPARFNCTKCGSLVSSVVLSQPSSTLTSPDPFAYPFASALHVTCNNPSCGAVHCRGCLQAVKCRDVEHPSSADLQALVPVSSNPTSPTRPTFTPSKSHQHIHTQAQNQRACAGGPGCALWSCCPTVRVIAIWEALRAFDALFSTEAGFQVSSSQNQHQGKAGHPQTQGQAELGRQYREAYVRMVISKADRSMRKFEDGFVRVLKVVGSWLQVPAEPSAQFIRDGGSSRRQSTLLDPDQSQSLDSLLRVAQLFLSSHLPEVMHTFLSNRNVKDWMTHAETYLDVLEVVKKLMDCGLGFLLKEISGPCLISPTPSSSAPGSTVSSGFYNPFAAPSPPSMSTSSSPSQSPPLVPLTLSSSSFPSGPVTLYELISQLESFRGDLKKFLSKVSFGVTVDKASKLHETITYLMLQLVVGEF